MITSVGRATRCTVTSVLLACLIQYVHISCLGRVNVFGRGMDQQLWYNYLSQRDFEGWQKLDERPLSSSPAVTARLWTSDVFAFDSNGHLLHKSFTANSWQPWTDVASEIVV